MKLIEDLGMQYATAISKHKARYGIYECPICNKYFKCRANSVKSGNTTKCKACASRLLADADAKKASRTFATKAETLHSNKYDYIFVEYLNNSTKVQIVCQIHGEFWQTPSNHLSGQGCPKCGNMVFPNIALRMSVNIRKPTTLYYVYFPEYNLWKIGCTGRDVDARFIEEKTNVEILWVKTYEDSREAYSVEGWVLKATKSTLVSVKPLKSGNTELRSEPILNLLDLVEEAETSFRESVLPMQCVLI